MGNDYQSLPPSGRAIDVETTAADDPGPWLSQRSPIGLGGAAGGSHAAAAASIDGSALAATVKWFRADKGYGFVELSGGQGDAFLHLNALRLAGRESVPTGAKLRVVISAGPKGVQVSRVIEVDASSVVGAPERSVSAGARAQRRPAPDASTAVDLTGRVKWFDGVRGFGFVAGDDYGKDVFVHCSVLGSAGVSRLAEGQTVAMRVIETPKGREAIEISV
jgi:CspA family cold shock protein